MLDLVLEHIAAGRLSRADEICRLSLERDPSNPDAFHLLGLIAHRRGLHADAVELIERAHRLGRPHPASWNHLGMAYAADERYREARKCFAKALGLKPDFAEAHLNLGVALKHLGEAKEAERSYRRALALAPEVAEVHYNLGNLLVERGRTEEAIQAYRTALQRQPRHLRARNNLGRALAELGQSDEAEQTFRAALTLDPEFIEAHHNLGNVLKTLGQLEDAERSYEAAIRLDPSAVDSRLNLGTVLHRLERYEEAAQCYRELLRIEPGFAMAYFNLGNSLGSLDRWREAADCFREATLLAPHFMPARWSFVTAQLPAVYDADTAPEARRAAFSDALDELDVWVKGNPSIEGAAAIVQQPFYLVYHDENNRDLLARFGGLCSTLMQRWRERRQFPAIAARHGIPIKLGIVSSHIREHSVWTAITKGWLQHLDRNRFEIQLFHLDERYDEETKLAKSLASAFAHGLRPVEDWTAAILNARLDVIAYPEVGMHALTTQLASMRLAKVQLASWGHPQTTGLSTIDYFLSAEAFEPRDADEHYTERLVRLPNLGCSYDPYRGEAEHCDRDALGIAADAPLLLCPGAPFKYLPRYDAVLIAIARRLERCQLVFFRHFMPSFSAKLEARLRQAFERAGLAFDKYVVFVPRQARSRFFGLMQQADVFLDTIGFSGFNTVLQSVECGLPIVTLEGRFMRGRFGSGILQRMGLPELVTSSESEYIELAVTLATNQEARRRMRRQIEERREVLYRDTLAAEALQDFLPEALRNAR